MAGKRIETEVAVSVTGEEKVEKLAKTMDKLEPVEVPVTSNTDKAIAAIEKVAAEAKKTEAAAEALGQALGPQLAAKADLTGMVSDLQRMGLTLDEVTADADRLATTIKETGAGSGLRGLDGELKSTASSASVLSNTIGNTTQDLAGMAGITGTAGVALGQMGEYMSDAVAGGQSLSSVVGSFAKVAGPIAVLTAAVGAGMQAWQAYKEEQARLAKVTEDASKQLLEQAGLIERLNAAVEGTDLASLIPDQDLDKFTQSLGQFGFHLKDLDTVVTQVATNTEGFFATILEGQGVTSETAAQIAEIVAQTDKYSEAMALALTGNYSSETQRFIRDNKSIIQSLEDTQDAVEDLDFEELNRKFDQQLTFSGTRTEIAAVNKALADYEARTGHAATGAEALRIKQEALTASQTIGAWALEQINNQIAGWVESTVKAVEKQQEMNTEVRDAALAWDEAAEMGQSYADALEDINDASDVNFAQQAFKTVKSFDTMKESLRELKAGVKDWKNVDLVPDSVEEFQNVPDEVIKVTEAIAGMRDSVQTELQGVFATEGIDAWSEKFDFFAAEARMQFTQMFLGMGLSLDEATTKTDELLGELGLLPASKEVQIKLTNEQQARAALDTFAGFIAKLPENVQVAINTAIAEEDIPTAIALLNDQLIQRGYDPILLGTEADTSGAQGDVDRFIVLNNGRVFKLYGDVALRPASGGVGSAGGGGVPIGTATRAAPEEEGVGISTLASDDVVAASWGSTAVAVVAGQPITNNTYVTIPTADPSAMVRALQRWTRSNGALPITRGRG
jgi:hypothetical protein